MQVVRSEILGFCFGVRRAVELAQKSLEENPEKKIYSLGPLIHNEMVLTQLEEKGLSIIDEKEIFSIPENSIVIIRAHGTEPDIYELLARKNCRIIDATCPRVKGSQNLVKKHSDEKDYVVFTGDKNHGEVKSIEGFGKENFILLQNKKDAIDFCKKTNAEKSVLLLSQTTFSAIEFEEISNTFTERFEKLQIQNTICPATNERQNALLDLCKKVDGILVIGGKNSANTKRLFEIAKLNCKEAVFIQSAKDIPERFYSLERIGITAGASTPDFVIEEIQKMVEKSGPSM